MSYCRCNCHEVGHTSFKHRIHCLNGQRHTGNKNEMQWNFNAMRFEMCKLNRKIGRNLIFLQCGCVETDDFRGMRQKIYKNKRKLFPPSIKEKIPDVF